MSVQDIRRALRDKMASGRAPRCVGVYDALSARIAGQVGFDAVMTGGYSISAALLGQPDMGLLTLTEATLVVRNVTRATETPVVADIDTGFGNALNLQRTVADMENAGAAAVIVEDQVAPKRSPSFMSALDLVPVEEAVGKIEAAVAARRDPNFLIIARTDATVADEAIRRGQAYAKAGADLVQPISRTFADFAGLKALREAAGVPLSLQLLGWLERDLTPAQLDAIGGLVTYAVTPILTVAAALQQNLRSIIESDHSRALPIAPMPIEALSELLGKAEAEERQALYVR